jgi:hypothetical protein
MRMEVGAGTWPVVETLNSGIFRLVRWVGCSISTTRHSAKGGKEEKRKKRIRSDVKESEIMYILRRQGKIE